jgi:nucleoside-diphosphate-sugar epimerase
LITGGAGYLGSVLSEELLKKNYEVVVFDNLIYGDIGINHLYSNPNFKLIKGDLRNIVDILLALEDIDVVIHLAGIVGDQACDIHELETLEVNLFCTKLLVNICKYKRVKRFIFASSCSVYGKSDSILTEESFTYPLSLYADMKFKSEEEVLKISNGDFCSTILRMGTLYGVSPRMRFDLVVNTFTIRALKEKLITLHGGDQYRPFLHVRDAARAFIKCIEVDSKLVNKEIFNLSYENLTILSLTELIQREIKDTNLVIDTTIIDKRDYIVDSSKIINLLNLTNDYTILRGIHEIEESSYMWDDYTNSIYDNYKFLKSLNLIEL